jgi:hypothetical protein
MHWACVLTRLGWIRFFHQHFCHDYSSITHTITYIHHPAAPFIACLTHHGILVLSAVPPWTLAQQDTAIQRGPHPLAAKHHVTFLLEDMFDNVNMGCWLVLPYSSLHGHPRLKIAPLGILPQRDRRPHPIMDYMYNTVTQNSLPLAPFSAMQFGNVLQCILQQVAYCNPAFGPLVLTKIDMADGYYRIPLSVDTALQLVVTLPADGNSESLLGILLSLPMGWCLSPPFFCAFMETCADLTNTVYIPHPMHPFHDASVPQQQLPLSPSYLPAACLPYNPMPPQPHLHYTDVYMDDFLLIAQRSSHMHLMHSLLHHMNSIFADPLTSPHRLIVSASKNAKGDATFST